MAKIKKTKKKASPPKRKGYAEGTPAKDDDQAILEYAGKCLKECIDEESGVRADMLDDLHFCTLDQWPEDIRKERENDIENGPRPCLTIDKINQYIVQVVNDLKQGKPGINVRPQDDEADVETAKILKGIIRNIEDQSSADIAYGVAAENAVKMGLAYVRVTNEYVSEDSFDQEIRIRSIPNTFSVYLRKHIMPDGSDAERGYIIEVMPKDKFKTEHPGKKCEAKDFDGVSPEMLSFWKTDDTVTVVEEYCIEKSTDTLCFLADGSTISRKDYDAWPVELQGERPTIQDERTTVKRQLKWRKMTAVEVLDKRDLPGKYIPIAEMVGRESFVDGKRILWGLVRPAKDSLRMYNYFASTITEKMGLAPKTPIVGAVGQFATMAERWKKANRVNYSYLEYDPIDVNGNAIPPPQRQGPPPIEAALLKQMQVIEHDVQTSLGMFKAAVGETESQQSGRAILALQKESDTGTYHFGANQSICIRHVGRIILDLIPHYYDTKRIVRIIGDDGEVQSAQLDPNQETAREQIQTGQGIKNIYNPGVGKYDVTITVGPSYNTKRMEDQTMFVEMAKGATDPGSAAVLRYLVMRNSDTPGAQEAAKLLKSLLPPQAQQALQQDGNMQVPPQVQAQMQQMQQKIQVMDQAGHKMAEQLQQAKSGQAEAQAKIAATREAKMAELQLEREVEQEKAQLARQRLTEESALRRAVAEAERADELAKAQLEARTKIEVAEIAAGATLQSAQIAAAAQATKPAAGAS